MRINDTARSQAEQVTVIQFLRQQGRDPFAIQADDRPLRALMEEAVDTKARELGLTPVRTGRVVWSEEHNALAEAVDWGADDV
ncbi:hypothetical protein G3480_25535 [Thiorhodococcus mannitoliphagus]|uniref:Uncharacterized protein n=1 Tax=Thiorhodococcus mannitoliphagus TaxID=329406 RepID=A0A6P1DZ53_9GAMM|nr:hypothetical protein [Thiorhodococcus mannitoliphagus]NEX23597.1 hypothetical protein [Thiorhodococcus mannitoliphagus]